VNASPYLLKVLIADDEANIRKTLALCLENQEYQVTCVSNAQDLLDEVSRNSFDLAFLDLRLGHDNSLDLIPTILTQSPWIKIVVITAFATVDTAVEAMKRGATDYLPKPFTPDQVSAVAHKVEELRALEIKVASLQEATAEWNPEDMMESQNPAMQRALTLAQQAARSDATILIRGESGTGKGVFSRAIHLWSPRSHKPFSVVACPSLSAELLESEMFGHAKGAFTGAVRENPGRVKYCEGGTLLLDEIGDLPPPLQPKLLRFIQDREYERVGDPITRKANVRVIVATNRDLESLVKEGRFREDLFYRLNVIEVRIPPLRERPEDIAPLSQRLLAFFGTQNHRPQLQFAENVISSLTTCAWPGNVRELRNAIERAAILCRSDFVSLQDLAPSLNSVPQGYNSGDLMALDKIEEQHIRRILSKTHSLQEAAAVLEIDEATLRRRRRKYGI